MKYAEFEKIISPQRMEHYVWACGGDTRKAMTHREPRRGPTNVLASSPEAPKRIKKRMMSDAEVITILICFHFNTYRNFKHYYLACVCGRWRRLFPRTLSYNRFVEIMPCCFIALTMFLRLACFGECTGISFVDSTCIPVIHNKRQFSMKVFKDIATKAGARWTDM